MPTYTPIQAAAMLRCSVATVYRRARAGRLTPAREAARLEIDVGDLADLLTRQREAETLSTDSVTAAARLGVTTATIYRLVHRGKLVRWPSTFAEFRVSNASLAQYMSTLDRAA